MQRVAKHESIESRYSIAVCIILSYSSAICIGWLSTAAVLLSELESQYKKFPFVEAQAGTVVSLTIAVSCFSCFIWIIIARRVGVKVVGIGSSLLVAASISISTLNSSISLWMLTFSIPVGVGFGGLFCVGIVLQPLYFDRHIGLASGIAASLGGLMTFIYPILWGTLVPKFGFNTTMYVFAGMIGSNAIPQCFLKRTPIQKAPAYTMVVNDDGNNDNDHDSDSDSLQNPANSSSSTPEITDDITPLVREPPAMSRWQRIKKTWHFDVFEDRNYVILSVSVALSLLGLIGASIHLLAFAKLYYSHENIYILTSFMGLGAAFSKLLSALLVDYLPVRLSVYVLQLCIVFCSIIIIGVSFLMQITPHFYVLVTVMTVYSVLESPLYVMPMPILFRFMQKDSIPIAVAYQAAIVGIATAIGPSSSGLLYNLTLSYALCYRVAPVITLFAVNLLFLFKIDAQRPLI